MLEAHLFLSHLAISLMKKLMTLFRLLELTRAQPQYGYVIGEIAKSELSDLAQHHYLVTFIAWRLASQAKKNGAAINMEKVLEYALVHDLGELFGGDIATPYAQANPAARAAAKQFEGENQKYLSQFFAEDSEYVQGLFTEVMHARSDEALIAKIADYIEVIHYKLFIHRLTKGDILMAAKKIQGNINMLADKKAKKTIKDFLAIWQKELGKGKIDEIFEKDKK